MAASASMVAQLRGMINEPVETVEYTDTDLAALIERYPLIDQRGEAPYTWLTSGTAAPTQVANDVWIQSYDLSLVAAEIWDRKAGALAANYDFRVEGRGFTRSQAYTHASARARYFRSRRSPRTITARPEPPIGEDALSWIANAAEEDI